MTTPRWLNKASARVQECSWSLGSIFERYCDLEHRSLGQLAEELDCTPETISWMTLCRQPAPGRFAEDVESIASRFSVSAGRLAGIIRRVQVLDALRHDETDRTSDAAELLIAARDRAKDDK